MCLFKVDCPAEKKSPKEYCLEQDAGGLASQGFCNSFADYCYQYGECRMSTEFGNIDLENIENVECDSNENCASGYCVAINSSLKSFILERAGISGTDVSIPNKACMPVSRCMPTCSENGEAIGEEGYCCAGLTSVTNESEGIDYCYNAVEALEEIPSRIEMSLEDDCETIMNEYDDEGRLVYLGSCSLFGAYTRADCRQIGGMWKAGDATMPIKERLIYLKGTLRGLLGSGGMLTAQGQMIFIEIITRPKI